MNAPLDPDPRLEKVEQIVIEWDTFKKALRRNYLDPDYEYQRQDRSFVLRLYPPFEATMEAQYYESEQGRHYNSEWNEKPFHMKPELFIIEGTKKGFRSVVDFPTEQSTRNALSDEEIEEIGGIEAAVNEGRDLFWDEMKATVPDSIDLGIFTAGPNGLDVEIEWRGIDE